MHYNVLGKIPSKMAKTLILMHVYRLSQNCMNFSLELRWQELLKTSKKKYYFVSPPLQTSFIIFETIYCVEFIQRFLLYRLCAHIVLFTITLYHTSSCHWSVSQLFPHREIIYIHIYIQTVIINLARGPKVDIGNNVFIILPSYIICWLLSPDSV